MIRHRGGNEDPHYKVSRVAQGGQAGQTLHQVPSLLGFAGLNVQCAVCAVHRQGCKATNKT